MNTIIYNEDNLKDAIEKLSGCNQENTLINLANDLREMQFTSTGESVEQIKELNNYTIQLLENMDLLVTNTIDYLLYVADVISEIDSDLAKSIKNSISNPKKSYQINFFEPKANTKLHGGSSGNF